MSGIKMTRIADEDDGGVFDKPAGTFCWHDIHGAERRIFYRCPNNQECGVPVATGDKQANRWQWDGNQDAPTIKPSIQCQGCGWHGFITAGQMTTV